MRYAVALLVLSALSGCTPTPPPFVPLDTGPRMDVGADVGVDVGVDADEDAPEDVSMDAPEDAPEDVSMDAPEDVPSDVPTDVPADAPADDAPDTSCVMRADCDGRAGCEVVLGTVTNCQGCADRCVAPPGASPSCDFSTGCDWSCNMGFADCDAVDGNGCEVNTNTSLSHCGGCGMACGTTLLQAQATCTGGDCLIRCRAGFADCDGDLTMSSSNGCEINTNTSLAHCGGCGMVCSLPASAVNATASCATGMCRMVCNVGARDCDGNQANGCEIIGPVCP